MYPDSVTLRIRPTPASRLPAFWRRVLKHVPALAWLLSSRAAMSSSPLTFRSPRSTTMSSSRCSSRSGMQTRATRPSAVVSEVSWSGAVPSLRPPSHGIARGTPGQWPCGAPRVLDVCPLPPGVTFPSPPLAGGPTAPERPWEGVAVSHRPSLGLELRRAGCEQWP